MSALAKGRYFLRSAVGGMLRSPFVHAIAVASLMLALLGYGVARVAAAQLDALVASLGSEAELTVYLAPGVEEADLAGLEEALRGRVGGEVRRVSPAEALGRLEAQLGERGKALLELSSNPLPWTLEVAVPPAAREAGALADLAARVRELPLVTDVDYGAAAVERLEVVSGALKTAAGVVFALVFLTAIVIVSATLQLAIFSRREEIEIQKLVGATDRFVRIPFLLEGALQGLVAGLIAAVVVVAGLAFLGSESASAAAFLRAPGGPAVEPVRLAGEMVGLGVLLGLSGSFVAVRRFLSV